MNDSEALKNKNILYISYDGMTDPLGQSQVIPYIQGLSKEGYRFTLLSCEKENRYEQNKNIIKNILDKSGIDWIPMIYHKSPPIISTVYDLFSLGKKAISLYKEKKFTLVHCRSYTGALIGHSLYKKYKVPFIFDMRGFYADERVDGGLWPLSNPLYHLIYKYFKKKEKDFLKFSSTTISLTNSGKKVMEQWVVCKENKTRIEVIPCASDFSMFIIPDQEEKLRNRKKYNIPENAFVLSYLGSLGTWYMLEEMLDFFKILLEKNPSALFLFLTSDNPQEILNTARKKNIPTEKIIIDFAQRKEVAEKLSVSNLNIFFIKPCFSKLASSPTKMGEVLAMGIPIICNDAAGDVSEIIDYTKGGITISSFTKEAYTNVLDQLDAAGSMNVYEVRQKAQEYYDLEKSVKKYSDVYAQILNTNA